MSPERLTGEARDLHPTAPAGVGITPNEAMQLVEGLLDGDITPPLQATQHHTEGFARFSECYGRMVLGVALEVRGTDYTAANFRRGPDGTIQWKGPVEADFGRAVKDHLVEGARNFLSASETCDPCVCMDQAVKMAKARALEQKLKRIKKTEAGNGAESGTAQVEKDTSGEEATQAMLDKVFGGKVRIRDKGNTWEEGPAQGVTQTREAAQAEPSSRPLTQSPSESQPPARSQRTISPKDYNACGGLAVILDELGAPEEVRHALAKRVGGVIGNGNQKGPLLTHGQVEKIISNSTRADGSIDWQVVLEASGTPVRDIYQGRPPKVLRRLGPVGRGENRLHQYP